MSVHDVAASGFGAEAAAYERARPSYPADAVDVDRRRARVCRRARGCADLAAGTGKFTRLLDARLAAAELVAVEPVEGMRRFLAASLPRVPVVSAIAEACPFAPASLDAITVAQAFHWFDARRALEELHRVLRPGGRLGAGVERA